MRILLCSYAFWPSLGGMELVSENIATAFAHAGHDVTVLTFSPDGGPRDFPFRVIRAPDRAEQWALFRNADLVVSRHLAVRCCWPLLFLKRRFLIWHATWYPDDEPRIARTLRHRLMARAINIANSAAMCRALPYCHDVIHPGYREDAFVADTPRDSRGTSFVFLGRLDGEKGVDLLIDAMVLLPEHGLTIIGDGAQRSALVEQVERLSLSNRIQFVGRKDATAGNAILNQHRVLVAPSRYNEPFGAVALEGLAAGCHVVVSSGGGLPDAAGPGGEVFDERSPEALAEAMARALHPWSPEREQAVSEHLRANRFSESFRRLNAIATADA